MWYLAQVRLSETRKVSQRSDNIQGPAHAVYFATYEVVKQAMGGNAAGHHPVAAGKVGRCSQPAQDTDIHPQQPAVHAPRSPATPS